MKNTIEPGAKIIGDRQNLLGTLGMFLKKRDEIYILTSYHIIGDSEKVFYVDDDHHKHEIAKVCPEHSCSFFKVDYALAKLNPGVGYRKGYFAAEVSSRWENGLDLSKIGAANKYTSGRIVTSDSETISISRSYKGSDPPMIERLDFGAVWFFQKNDVKYPVALNISMGERADEVLASKLNMIMWYLADFEIA